MVEGHSSIKPWPTAHAKLYHVLKVMTDHRRCKVSLALPSFDLALPFMPLSFFFRTAWVFGNTSTFPSITHRIQRSAEQKINTPNQSDLSMQTKGSFEIFIQRFLIPNWQAAYKSPDCCYKLAQNPCTMHSAINHTTQLILAHMYLICYKCFHSGQFVKPKSSHLGAKGNSTCVSPRMLNLWDSSAV